MDVTAYAVCFGLAFLSGSIPFAVLIGRAKGVDIRKVGSGNPGATNLGRALGRKWGLTCFVLDVLKGLVPVLGFGMVLFWVLTKHVDANEFMQIDWAGTSYGKTHSGTNAIYFFPTTIDAVQWLGVALAPVIGHMFSPWLGFKGGKGVATGLGAALGLFPYVTLPGVVCGVVWFVCAKLTGYVGLASCLAAALLPVLTAVNGVRLGLDRGPLLVFVGLTALLALLVILRHRANLRRLLSGTEPKAAWTGKA